MANDMHERDLVMQYIAADTAAKEIKVAAKNANDILEKAKLQLIEYLESKAATATATYEGFGRVQINKPRLYASVSQENLDTVMNFLRDIGRDDLIKTNINPQSLSSYVTECIELGTEFPEEIAYYLKPQLRIYGA